MAVEQKEELRDALTSLLICEKNNPNDPIKLKGAAHHISQRMHNKENYTFLIYVRRSSNPSGAIQREIKNQGFEELYQ